MSDTNALPTPQPSTANLVEIIVPGFIRVNVPKADAEKLYQSLGVTLGHRPAENPMPQQAWNLDAMRIEKNIASIRNESIEGSTIDSVGMDAKHLQAQIASLRLQLAESRHENSQIQGQLADRTADVNELTGKLRDVQVWMGKSKDENARLTSSLEALEKDRLDLAGTYKSALEQIDKLKRENAALAASNESANKRAEMEKRAKESSLADLQAEKIKMDKLREDQWNPPTHSEVQLACMTIQQQLRMVASSISTNSSPGQLQAANIIRVGATTIDVVQEQLRCAEALNRCAPKPAAGPLAGAIIDHLKEAADNERKIKALRVPHNPENIDLAKYPLPPGYVIASKGEIPEEVPGDWLTTVYTGKGEWDTMDRQALRRRYDGWTYARPIRPGDQEAPLP